MCLSRDNLTIANDLNQIHAKQLLEIQCCNERRRFIERWEDLMLPVSSRVFSQHQQVWQNVNFQRCVCATRPNTCNSEWDHCAVSQSFCQNLLPHTQRNVLSQLKFISRLISSFQCQLELCHFPGALKRTAHPLHLSFNLSLFTHTNTKINGLKMQLFRRFHWQQHKLYCTCTLQTSSTHADYWWLQTKEHQHPQWTDANRLGETGKQSWMDEGGHPKRRGVWWVALGEKIQGHFLVPVLRTTTWLKCNKVAQPIQQTVHLIQLLYSKIWMYII